MVGMEQMTREEALETVRDMLTKWDTGMKAVMAQGYSEVDAEEIVGRYFTAQAKKEGNGSV